MRFLQGRRLDAAFFHFFHSAQRAALLTALLVAAPGCTDGDLTVTFVDTHVTDRGEIQEPRGLTGLTVNAYTLDRDDGGLRKLDGHVSDEGVFTFVDVPKGDVHLHVKGQGSNEVIITSERELDLGELTLGRPDARLATVPTAIALDIDGLSPWQDEDGLLTYALGSGTFGFLDDTLERPLSAGTTALTTTADASLLQVPGVTESSRGDRVYMTQLVTRPFGEGEARRYWSVGKVYAPPSSFTLVEGATSAWSGTMADVPQIPLHLDWRRAEFAALAAQVHPAAVVDRHSVFLTSQPAGERVAASVSPMLLWLDDPASEDAALDLTYGNPYPSHWSAVGSVYTRFYVDLKVPDTGLTVRLDSLLSVSRHARAMGTSALVPVVTPPRGLQIDGMDAQITRRGVGASPKVSIAETGASGALSYTYALYRLAPGSTSMMLVGVVHTERTEIGLELLGALQQGSWYQVRVTAQPRSDHAVNRRSVTWDGASADVISGLFTP
ncbi:hypothetical protein [Chondromyces apiculatus]|uniref:Uncharacterized protein n=1 Tax=Chondromyces apiculatus DSM 436 TaxID=1192034 RepID=A0A017STK9_9BACT|nr:hypothetical protein [Chondromyces apiculatus]EYF00082.1 Hypothetical protein CAP_1386 [Chondromyces apiculatus DSM 436]